MSRLVSVFVLCTVLFISHSFVLAENETPTPTPTSTLVDSEKAKLEGKIAETQRKLDETRREKNTLAAEKEYIDTQTYVTELRIEDTEGKITTVQKEADILSGRIDSLDDKLDRQWKLFLATTYASYKQRSASLLDLVLNARTASDMLSSMKYHSLAQSNRQRILVQTQETKLNFEEQKQLREVKKDELTKLQNTLATQKNSLEQQQVAKQILIAATQNRETEYQNIISEALRQVRALGTFFASTGVGSISANGLGTGEGGWYYSQRDERWASMRMGGSSESVLDVGCLITSVSMVLKAKGQDVTPITIASNPRYFSGGIDSGCFPGGYPTAYACFRSTFNGSWPGNLQNRRGLSRSEVDEQLEKGNPVIAGVYGPHFIVLKKKVDGEYIMNDPIYGPDLKVSSHYTLTGEFEIFE
jgi:peptidoglycan hydrolase CwlO-like protein